MSHLHSSYMKRFNKPNLLFSLLSKELDISFAITAAGVVPWCRLKTFPRKSSKVQIYFTFASVRTEITIRNHVRAICSNFLKWGKMLMFR